MGNYRINNLALKIISLLAALIMWMYVMNEQNPQIIRDFKVPIKLLNLNSDVLAIKDDSQQYFTTVKVKGRRSKVNDIKPKDFIAEASLRGRVEGENLLSISVSTPDNMELLDYSPREIMVALDSIVEEQLSVTVDVKGTPAGGFGAEGPLVKPQDIVVKGPRTLVNSIKKVAALVDVSGKRETVVGTLPLRVLDGQGKDLNEVTFRPDVVEVTVPIVPVSRVTLRPDIKGDPPEGYIIRDVTVDTPTVLVTASHDVLANLQSIDTDPITIEGQTKTVQRDVNIRFPRGVRLFEEDLKTVQVTVLIEKLTTASLKLPSGGIEVQNPTPDTAVILEEREITLEASGPESVIDRVSNNMVKIYVDVTGLAEGEHQIKIKADISRPYVITKIEPLEIGVTVRRLDSSKKGDNI